jgi:hypothetical protein
MGFGDKVGNHFSPSGGTFSSALKLARQYLLQKLYFKALPKVNNSAVHQRQ